MSTVVKINHMAVIVEDLEKSLSFWRDTLGLSLTERRDVPAEAAEIAFLPVGESELELVRPTSADSGLARFLAKRGPGMHHLCLEVQDIDGLLSDLRGKGVHLINETPRTASDGRRYAFIHPDSTSGVLIELYEK